MQASNRGAALQRLAYQLQMEYHETDPWNFDTRLSEFRLFRRGMRRRSRHILRQQHELMEYDLRVFDYSFTTMAGKHAKRHDQTVFYLHSTRAVLPECWLRPEHLFHKVGELLGFDDIDFEAHPRFSGQYRLTGSDESFIRHHFTDEVLHFFSLQRGWSLEAMGFQLILYKKNKLLPPAQIEQFYQQGLAIYQLLVPADSER